MQAKATDAASWTRRKNASGFFESAAPHLTLHQRKISRISSYLLKGGMRYPPGNPELRAVRAQSSILLARANPQSRAPLPRFFHLGQHRLRESRFQEPRYSSAKPVYNSSAAIDRQSPVSEIFRPCASGTSAQCSGSKMGCVMAKCAPASILASNRRSSSLHFFGDRVHRNADGEIRGAAKTSSPPSPCPDSAARVIFTNPIESSS